MLAAATAELQVSVMKAFIRVQSGPSGVSTRSAIPSLTRRAVSAAVCLTLPMSIIRQKTAARSDVATLMLSCRRLEMSSEASKTTLRDVAGWMIFLFHQLLRLGI